MVKYDVCYGTLSVGKVEVIREGLYYRFICGCDRCGDEMLRLFVQQGGEKMDLGIGIPTGDRLNWDTRIAAKNLCDGKPRFYLSTRPKKKDTQFIPVHACAPFPAIVLLEEARFCVENGQPGVEIPCATV